MSRKIFVNLAVRDLETSKRFFSTLGFSFFRSSPYGWSFYDPDGHHWEVFWMDPKAA